MEVNAKRKIGEDEIRQLKRGMEEFHQKEVEEMRSSFYKFSDYAFETAHTLSAERCYSHCCYYSDLSKLLGLIKACKKCDKQLFEKLTSEYHLAKIFCFDFDLPYTSVGTAFKTSSSVAKRLASLTYERTDTEISSCLEKFIATAKDMKTACTVADTYITYQNLSGRHVYPLAMPTKMGDFYADHYGRDDSVILNRHNLMLITKMLYSYTKDKSFLVEDDFFTCNEERPFGIVREKDIASYMKYFVVRARTDDSVVIDNKSIKVETEGNNMYFDFEGVRYNVSDIELCDEIA